LFPISVMNSVQTAPPDEDPFAPPASAPATRDAKPVRSPENALQDDKPFRHLVREEHNAEGVLVKRERFHVKKNGEEVRHGLQELWWNDKTLHTLKQFSNGKQNGVELNWLPDDGISPGGTFQFILPFNQAGRPDGDYVEFYSSGRKRKEATYVNGKIVGSRLTYDYDRRAERRTVLEEKFDKNGEKFHQTSWDDKGKKLHEGQFKGEESLVLFRDPGIPHGKWTYWVGKERSQEVHGEFRDGKPWEGICHDPDARYMVLPGLGALNRYSEGKLVESNVKFE
jgi:antitoxin component YwqK of YwqJK toxin-antitoxin module